MDKGEILISLGNASKVLYTVRKIEMQRWPTSTPQFQCTSIYEMSHDSDIVFNYIGLTMIKKQQLAFLAFKTSQIQLLVKHN